MSLILGNFVQLPRDGEGCHKRKHGSADRECESSFSCSQDMHSLFFCEIMFTVFKTIIVVVHRGVYNHKPQIRSIWHPDKDF
jgi:hypothetical protein